jgi:CAAX prenyl protease-like protein
MEDTASPPPAAEKRRLAVADDTAYFLPMAVFLVFVAIGGHWKSLYVPAYAARTVIVAVMLWVFRRHYTKIRWNHWWLGVVVGVVGIFQWVGMQKWLETTHFSFFKPSPDFFDPIATFPKFVMRCGFYALRICGAVLVVPFMEELFWRDYLWRYISAPNDFKLATVGEKDWKSFLIVSIIFATVHGNWGLTAIVWAMMIGGLLIATRSLGACIIAHAVTNLLLAAYVLKTQDWSLW